MHTTDRYGRLVADVILENGLDYGQEMLRKGAAWVSFFSYYFNLNRLLLCMSDVGFNFSLVAQHYKAYDKRQELADLEQEARNAGVGLWSYARPQEPWVYRKKKRERQRND